MPTSANHHYIAQVILKYFCFRREQVYYFSRHRSRPIVQARNVESIFKKRHLNSFEKDDGTKDDSLEKFFAENFDAHITSIIEIAESCAALGSQFRLDEDAFTFFIQFFYNHMKRTPDFHQPIVEEAAKDDFFLDAVEDLEVKYGKISEEARKAILSPKQKKKTIDRSRVINLSRQSSKVLDLLAKMQPVVAVADGSRKQFIIASNPVVRLTNSGGVHLENDDVELWTTLTPKIAVGLVRCERPIKPIRVNGLVVKKINKELVKRSTSVASASKELLNSLVNGK